MIAHLLHHITRTGQAALHAIRRGFLATTQLAPPVVATGVLLGCTAEAVLD